MAEKIEEGEIGRAFKRLGLTTDASDDEVRAAYRTMSFNTHPDLIQTADSTEKQAELNEAYRIALSYTELRTAIVPVSRQVLIKSVRDALVPETVAVLAATKAEQIKRTRSSPLRTYKTIAWVISGISAMLAMLSARLPDIVKLSGGTSSSQQTSDTVLVAAILCASAGLVLQIMCNRTERGVDSYLADLEDPRFCAAELARCLEFKDVRTFTEDFVGRNVESEQDSARKVPFLLLGMRGRSLAPLMLLKARGHGLIELTRPLQITPDSVAEYTVTFRPSAFGPARQHSTPQNSTPQNLTPQNSTPQNPPAPPTRSEARSNIIGGALMFLGSGAGAVLLVLKGHHWWAVLPGILSFGCMLMLIEGFSQLRQLRDSVAKGKD